MLKEKFLNDIKELDTKINVYFNQNETCKRSLSPKRERKNLDKLFENYWINSLQVTQKESNVALYKDKVKSLTQETKTLKADLKRVNDVLQKVTEEKNALMKKKSFRFSKSTADLENKENIQTEKKDENIDPAFEAQVKLIFKTINRVANDSQS